MHSLSQEFKMAPYLLHAHLCTSPHADVTFFNQLWISVKLIYHLCDSLFNFVQGDGERTGEDHPFHYGPDTKVQDTQVRAPWSQAVAPETPKVSTKAKNSTIKLMV